MFDRINLKKIEELIVFFYTTKKTRKFIFAQDALYKYERWVKKDLSYKILKNRSLAHKLRFFLSDLRNENYINVKEKIFYKGIFSFYRDGKINYLILNLFKNFWTLKLLNEMKKKNLSDYNSLLEEKKIFINNFFEIQLEVKTFNQNFSYFSYYFLYVDQLICYLDYYCFNQENKVLNFKTLDLFFKIFFLKDIKNKREWNNFWYVCGLNQKSNKIYYLENYKMEYYIETEVVNYDNKSRWIKKSKVFLEENIDFLSSLPVEPMFDLWNFFVHVISFLDQFSYIFILVLYNKFLFFIKNKNLLYLKYNYLKKKNFFLNNYMSLDDSFFFEIDLYKKNFKVLYPTYLNYVNLKKLLKKRQLITKKRLMQKKLYLNEIILNRKSNYILNSIYLFIYENFLKKKFIKIFNCYKLKLFNFKKNKLKWNNLKKIFFLSIKLKNIIKAILLKFFLDERKSNTDLKFRIKLDDKFLDLIYFCLNFFLKFKYNFNNNIFFLKNLTINNFFFFFNKIINLFALNLEYNSSKAYDFLYETLFNSYKVFWLKLNNKFLKNLLKKEQILLKNLESFKYFLYNKKHLYKLFNLYILLTYSYWTLGEYKFLLNFIYKYFIILLNKNQVKVNKKYYYYMSFLKILKNLIKNFKLNNLYKYFFIYKSLMQQNDVFLLLKIFFIYFFFKKFIFNCINKKFLKFLNSFLFFFIFNFFFLKKLKIKKNKKLFKFNFFLQYKFFKKYILKKKKFFNLKNLRKVIKNLDIRLKKNKEVNLQFELNIKKFIIKDLVFFSESILSYEMLYYQFENDYLFFNFKLKNKYLWNFNRINNYLLYINICIFIYNNIINIFFLNLHLKKKKYYYLFITGLNIKFLLSKILYKNFYSYILFINNIQGFLTQLPLNYFRSFFFFSKYFFFYFNIFFKFLYKFFFFYKFNIFFKFKKNIKFINQLFFLFFLLKIYYKNFLISSNFNNFIKNYSYKWEVDSKFIKKKFFNNYVFNDYVEVLEFYSYYNYIYDKFFKVLFNLNLFSIKKYYFYFFESYLGIKYNLSVEYIYIYLKKYIYILKKFMKRLASFFNFFFFLKTIKKVFDLNLKIFLKVKKMNYLDALKKIGLNFCNQLLKLLRFWKHFYISFFLKKTYINNFIFLFNNYKKEDQIILNYYWFKNLWYDRKRLYYFLKLKKFSKKFILKKKFLNFNNLYVQFFQKKIKILNKIKLKKKNYKFIIKEKFSYFNWNQLLYGYFFYKFNKNHSSYLYSYICLEKFYFSLFFFKFYKIFSKFYFISIKNKIKKNYNNHLKNKIQLNIKIYNWVIEDNVILKNLYNNNIYNSIYNKFNLPNYFLDLEKYRIILKLFREKCSKSKLKKNKKYFMFIRHLDLDLEHFSLNNFKNKEQENKEQENKEQENKEQENKKQENKKQENKKAKEIKIIDKLFYDINYLKKNKKIKYINKKEKFSFNKDYNNKYFIQANKFDLNLLNYIYSNLKKKFQITLFYIFCYFLKLNNIMLKKKNWNYFTLKFFFKFSENFLQYSYKKKIKKNIKISNWRNLIYILSCFVFYSFILNFEKILIFRSECYNFFYNYKYKYKNFSKYFKEIWYLKKSILEMQRLYITFNKINIIKTFMKVSKQFDEQINIDFFFKKKIYLFATDIDTFYLFFTKPAQASLYEFAKDRLNYVKIYIYFFLKIYLFFYEIYAKNKYNIELNFKKIQNDFLLHKRFLLENLWEKKVINWNYFLYYIKFFVKKKKVIKNKIKNLKFLKKNIYFNNKSNLIMQKFNNLNNNLCINICKYKYCNCISLTKNIKNLIIYYQKILNLNFIDKRIYQFNFIFCKYCNNFKLAINNEILFNYKNKLKFFEEVLKRKKKKKFFFFLINEILFFAYYTENNDLIIENCTLIYLNSNKNIYKYIYFYLNIFDKKSYLLINKFFIFFDFYYFNLYIYIFFLLDRFFFNDFFLMIPKLIKEIQAIDDYNKKTELQLNLFIKKNKTQIKKNILNFLKQQQQKNFWHNFIKKKNFNWIKNDKISYKNFIETVNFSKFRSYLDYFLYFNIKVCNIYDLLLYIACLNIHIIPLKLNIYKSKNLREVLNIYLDKKKIFWKKEKKNLFLKDANINYM